MHAIPALRQSDVAFATPVGSNRRSRLMPEVQALRALAVTIVVVFHVWPDVLPGGFLGVDVFFVISGFLIGSHLFREVHQTGTLSLTWFWARRIRRILPAAMVVLIAAVLTTLWVVPRTMWPDTFLQAGSASVYVVNWVLAFQSVDYLGAEDPPTIVQHFWSLSVEEQFYILLPLVLVIAIFLVRTIVNRVALTRAVLRIGLAVIVLGTAASFVYSTSITIYAPNFAYFDTFARAWEFGCGVILGAIAVIAPRWFESVRQHPILGRSRLLTVLGLVVILVVATSIDGSTLFPAPLALIPVAGVILVILGGFSTSTSIGPLLGMRPVQFLGDISYSTYLWHWLVLTWFIYWRGYAPGLVGGIAILAATGVLAWLTKIFVEDPVRRSRALGRRRWPAYTLAATSAAVVVTLVASLSVITAPRAAGVVERDDCYGASAMLSGAACAEPFAVDEATDFAAAAADLDTSRWCLTWYTEEWRTCELGDPAATNGVLALVGDSYAASYAVAFDEFFSAHGWKVETFTRFGCPGLAFADPELSASDLSAQESINCRTWSDRVREEILSRDDITAVVFINRPPGRPKSPEEASRSVQPGDVEKSWDLLVAKGKKVVTVRTSPDLDVGKVPTCLALNVANPALCARPRSEVVAWAPEDDALAAGVAGVTSIDMTDAFCDSAMCFPMIGGVVVYADERHVSGRYSRSVLDYLGPALLDAFAGRGSGSTSTG